MSDDSLIQAMPDLVAFIRPDGLITHHLGGRGVPFMSAGARGGLAGQRLAEVLDARVHHVMIRLVRRALAGRDTCEAEFAVGGSSFQARISAQGPERVLCVIRQLADSPGDERQEQSTAGVADRRFLHRFEGAVAEARLRERSLAVGVIFLDGVGDISQLIDFSIGERIVEELLQRIPQSGDAGDGVSWFAGQFGEAMLGIVIEGSTDRERLQAVTTSLCQSIAIPLPVQDATFHIAPSAGLAILGEDALRPRALLDHARAAMLEARRSGPGSVHFYSDTLRMLPIARLDVARELRGAIEEEQIFLHYVARHDLSSGALTGIQAYMRWTHPLRGDIPPARFLPIANATGLAAAVSRAALDRLMQDITSLQHRFGMDIPVSFGALRQHLSSGQLLRDWRKFASTEPRRCVELRVSERNVATMGRPEQTLSALADAGARLVIDEMGRSLSSLPRLTRLPLCGLQVDRALAVAAKRSSAALRACGAIALLAKALDLRSITSGVDDAHARNTMSKAGFGHGFGDLYAAILPVPGDSRRQAILARKNVGRS